MKLVYYLCILSLRECVREDVRTCVPFRNIYLLPDTSTLVDILYIECCTAIFHSLTTRYNSRYENYVVLVMSFLNVRTATRTHSRIICPNRFYQTKTQKCSPFCHRQFALLADALLEYYMLSGNTMFAIRSNVAVKVSNLPSLHGFDLININYLPL